MKEDGRQKVLIVDDTPENIHILVEVLRDEYVIMVATSGEKALQLAMQQPQPDLILLDIMMPVMDGYETFARLKSDARTFFVPIIFITAMGESEDENKGLEMGAVDYIIKPFVPNLVKARVRNQLELKRYRDRLEELVVDRSVKLELANVKLQHDLIEQRISLGATSTDLNAIIAEVAKNLQQAFGATLQVATAPCADPLPVLVDASQLSQILAYLAVEAKGSHTEPSIQVSSGLEAGYAFVLVESGTKDLRFRIEIPLRG